MTKKKIWLNRKEAWELVQKLVDLPHIGNVEKVAQLLGVATSTIYKWGAEPNKGDPDARITLELKELAVKEGVIKQ